MFIPRTPQDYAIMAGKESFYSDGGNFYRLVKKSGIPYSTSHNRLKIGKKGVDAVSRWYSETIERAVALKNEEGFLVYDKISIYIKANSYVRLKRKTQLTRMLAASDYWVYTSGIYAKPEHVDATYMLDTDCKLEYMDIFIARGKTAAMEFSLRKLGLLG